MGGDRRRHPAAACGGLSAAALRAAGLRRGPGRGGLPVDRRAPGHDRGRAARIERETGHRYTPLVLLPTFVDARRPGAAAAAALMRERFGDLVSPIQIPRSARYDSAALAGVPVVVGAPRSTRGGRLPRRERRSDRAPGAQAAEAPRGAQRVRPRRHARRAAGDAPPPPWRGGPDRVELVASPSGSRMVGAHDGEPGLGEQTPVGRSVVAREDHRHSKPFTGPIRDPARPERREPAGPHPPPDRREHADRPSRAA